MEEPTCATWTVERVQCGECLEHVPRARRRKALRRGVVGRAERCVLRVLEEFLASNYSQLQRNAAVVLLAVQLPRVRFAYL